MKWYSYFLPHEMRQNIKNTAQIHLAEISYLMKKILLSVVQLMKDIVHENGKVAH